MAKQILNLKNLFFIFILILLGCQSVPPEPSGPDRLLVLQNMPVNSNLRCVGISVTVEALLEQKYSKSLVVGDAEAFSERLYDSLFSPQSNIVLPREVKVDNRQLPIFSKEAMNHLGTLTTNIYKSEFQKAWKLY